MLATQVRCTKIPIKSDEDLESPDICPALVGWLAHDTEMAALDSILLVKIEQMVPKDSFSRSVYDNDE